MTTTGQTARFWSPCGPCIPSTVEKVNRTTADLRNFGKVPLWKIHTTPCSRCVDHANTSYPNGYMD